MARYSRTSILRLTTNTHPILQDVFFEVITRHDHTIIYGVRTIAEQIRFVETGASRTMDSKHLPQKDGRAWAIDAAPYPIDWKDLKRFYYFAGIVLGTFEMMQDHGRIRPDLRLIWGGDWDSDDDLNDQDFMDLVHFELQGVTA